MKEGALFIGGPFHGLINSSRCRNIAMPSYDDESRTYTRHIALGLKPVVQPAFGEEPRQ